MSVLPWGVANGGGRWRGGGGRGQATASLGLSQLETTEVPGNSCLSVHTSTHTDTMLRSTDTEGRLCKSKKAPGANKLRILA